MIAVDPMIEVEIMAKTDLNFRFGMRFKAKKIPPIEE